MSELTVADELAFDALPDETRALCEKIIESRVDDALRARTPEEDEDDVYSDGYRAGRAAERRIAEQGKKDAGKGEAAD